MKTKTAKLTVAAAVAMLSANCFTTPAIGQISDNFTTDSTLNTAIWTAQPSFLTALASASSSPGSPFLNPILSLGTAGMQMSGVSGTYEFTGIHHDESLQVFDGARRPLAFPN
jgi:hypothetical protein